MCKARTVLALLLALICGIMFVLNVVNRYQLAMMTSMILCCGFIFSAYLAGIKKNCSAASVIIAFMVCVVFSFFAVNGSSEGFAVLWVLLVPMFSISMLGLKTGVALSTYFLVFIVLLFYTPLNRIIIGKYTASFIYKFPVLYISDWFISFMMAFQREYFNRKVHLQSFIDEMTGAYNRRYFMNQILKKEIKEEKNVCVAVIDIDGLKQVNDSLGHEAGDELICAIPECCKKVFKKDYTLCRIGGDEFVLIFNETNEAARELLGKLKEAGENWQGKYSGDCRFSAGLASFDIYPEADMNELFIKADFEMYSNKFERRRKLYIQE